MSEPTLDSGAKVLILTPATNSHRRDFDNVFKPESAKLSREYGAACTVERVPVAPVDPVTLKVQSAQATFEAAARAVLAKIADGTAWTHIIMLCHGWATGIQLGFRSSKQQQRGNDAQHWKQLVAALTLPSLQVLTLYACSAGKEPRSKQTSPGTGNDSFADLLRDAAGVSVIAHFTAGHATTNPNLIMFERSSVAVLGGLLPAPKPSQAYANAIILLKGRPLSPGKRKPPKPPIGHGRLAFASIPLCQTVSQLHALLSAPPAP